MTSDHPLHAKFARLSEQEEKHGLLDDSATIGTREGWQAPGEVPRALQSAAIDSSGDDQPARYVRRLPKTWGKR